jgi:hypothetical protein
MMVQTHAEATAISSGVCQLGNEGLRGLSPESFRITFSGNEVAGRILSQSSVWKTSRRLPLHTFLIPRTSSSLCGAGSMAMTVPLQAQVCRIRATRRMSIADLHFQESIRFWFVASNHISAQWIKSADKQKYRYFFGIVFTGKTGCGSASARA